MPVPVSVRPVRMRIVLSLRISSHDASRVGSSEVWFSAALAENPAGMPSETKRAPPVLTKPRRVSVVVIVESIMSGPHLPGGALHGIDDSGVGAAAAQMRR